MFFSQLSQTVTSAPELLAYLAQNRSPIAQGDDSGLNVAVESGPPPAESVLVPLESPRPSLFALIIGINAYKNHPTPKNLRGATQDADAVQAFLTSELRVPADRIINLRNDKATREAIIKGIEGLANNPNIGVNDPILIYYAGHGGEADAPKGWQTSTNSRKIQMLIPHDFAFTGSETYEGQGVFDFHLGKLLEGLAKAKSDNITVIFDSCHSGSGTRDGRDPTHGIRGVELPANYAIPLHVLESYRDLGTPEGFENAGLRSHVLLSGCMNGQLSGEANGRGLFTSALLSVLQSDGVDKLTYEEVIKRLPIISESQNPQCEGVNQKRVFFDAEVPSPGRALVLIFNKDDVITLKAGEAYGVTTNARFAVYSDRKMTSLLGHVAVTATGAFESICKPVEDEGAFTFSEAFALQTRVGDAQDLAVAIQPDEKFLDVFAKIGQEMQLDKSKRSFRVVSSLDEQPQLALSKTEKDKVEFHILDKICRAYGLKKSPFDDIGVGESDYILEILRSAADFYWNLRNSARTPTPLSKKVRVECFRLASTGDFRDDLSEVLMPAQEDLVLNGQITIDVDKKAMYGYRITNRSTYQLWAALFYFSPSDLSISPVYLLGSARNGTVDCSIPAMGSLTIGYGDSGTIPGAYPLKDGKTKDVGFLKLYLATEYVDWSQIKQLSPFHQGRDFQAGQPPPKIIWDTITIPVIQQKLGGDPTRQVEINEEVFTPEFAATFDFKAEGGQGNSDPPV